MLLFLALRNARVCHDIPSTLLTTSKRLIILQQQKQQEAAEEEAALSAVSADEGDSDVNDVEEDEEEEEEEEEDEEEEDDGVVLLEEEDGTPLLIDDDDIVTMLDDDDADDDGRIAVTDDDVEPNDDEAVVLMLDDDDDVKEEEAVEDKEEDDEEEENDDEEEAQEQKQKPTAYVLPVSSRTVRNRARLASKFIAIVCVHIPTDSQFYLVGIAIDKDIIDETGTVIVRSTHAISFDEPSERKLSFALPCTKQKVPSIGKKLSIILFSSCLTKLPTSIVATLSPQARSVLSTWHREHPNIIHKLELVAPEVFWFDRRVSRLIPSYNVLGHKEVEELLRIKKITLESLPTILETDVVVKMYGWNTGTIVYAKEMDSYRMVA
jgi:DNA-directed RNA polymerase subunit H (RpoH/RPB5)